MDNPIYNHLNFELDRASLYRVLDDKRCIYIFYINLFVDSNSIQFPEQM